MKDLKVARNFEKRIERAARLFDTLDYIEIIVNEIVNPFKRTYTGWKTITQGSEYILHEILDWRV